MILGLGNFHFFLFLIPILWFLFTFNIIKIYVLFVLFYTFFRWVLNCPRLRVRLVWNQLGIYFLNVYDPCFIFDVFLIIWFQRFQILLIINKIILNLFSLAIFTVNEWHSHIHFWLIRWSIYKLIRLIQSVILFFERKFIHLFIFLNSIDFNDDAFDFNLFVSKTLNNIWPTDNSTIYFWSIYLDNTSTVHSR